MEPTVVPEVARRFAMAFLFLTHIQFAAFLIGLFTLAVVFEFFWLLNQGEPNLDRLAHGMGKTAAIMYSSGAVLAFAVILLAASFWPVFWDIILRITFWPFVMEAVTFVLTILYLFCWYFTWPRLARFRWTHLSLGAALVISAYFQQTLIDVVASYMLTPAPPDQFLPVFFNPTAVPLDMHRIVGDISFAGFVVGGYAAVRTLLAREEKDRAYYDWMGSLALIAGLGFLYLQPAIGLEYMQEIRANAPAAFDKMMRGSNSWLFLVQVAFVSILFLLSMIYILIQVRKSHRPGVRWLWVLLIVASLGALLLVQPYVLGPSQGYAWVNWVNPLGSMQPWKYIAMAGLTLSAILSILIYIGAQRKGMRWGYMGNGGRAAQYLLLVLAIFASFMMALMGYIRENSRVPFLIYNNLQLGQTERFPNLQPTPTPDDPFSYQPPPEGAAVPEIGASGGNSGAEPSTGSAEVAPSPNAQDRGTTP